MTSALLALFLTAASPARAAETALSTTTVALPDGRPIAVELALTPDQRERGLMYRTELSSGTGMLFVFDAEGLLPFWMKNTWIDLDILYLDSAGVITRIFRRVPRSRPDTPESQVARIRGWGRFVLELPAGAARRYGLAKGQRLRIRLPEAK